VKTLAIGEVAPPVVEQDAVVVHTERLSYFSRLTDSTTFERLALGEMHRRGVSAAHRVAAVMDGAVWLQGFVELHCPEAVRILDFPHAVGYLHAMGETIGAAGRLLSEHTISQLAHDLKHTGPQSVLAALRPLVATYPELSELATQLGYLEKRAAQMAYPQFQAAGLPIGSGSVESAHTVVVEARLNGAGMRWAREHVNPMLALRNAVCNDRWDEVWRQIEAEQRRQVGRRRQDRRRKRAATCPAAPVAAPPVPLLTPDLVSPPAMATLGAMEPVAPLPAPTPRRPAADHPWRRAWSPRRQLEESLAA
jgi:hypothetical protein